MFILGGFGGLTQVGFFWWREGWVWDGFRVSMEVGLFWDCKFLVFGWLAMDCWVDRMDMLAGGIGLVVVEDAAGSG